MRDDTVRGSFTDHFLLKMYHNGYFLQYNIHGGKYVLSKIMSFHVIHYLDFCSFSLVVN